MFSKRKTLDIFYRSVGDVVFDVAKEVVAEVVGGALTRIFGIGTAR